MILHIIPSDTSIESFDVIVTKERGRGCRCQFGIKHKDYIGFQYDSSNRPGDYSKEWAETLSFHGFLIGKKGKNHLECYIKVIFDKKVPE
jgi:hypothetical protein